MHLAAALALACCLLAAPQEPDEATAPTAEQVEAACTALAAAFEEGANLEEALGAVRAASEVPDARVVALLDREGLRSKEPKLRAAVVEALGRMPHGDALKALHRALERDEKALEKDPPAYAELLRAIGRHGDPSSIEVLTEDVFQAPDRAVTTARILGLGCIRTPEAVDELMQLMRSARREKVQDHMVDFRLALARLTGVDKGGSQELWLNWYGDAKGSLRIAPEPPELPRELQRRWDQYWGRETAARRAGKDRKGGDEGEEKRKRRPRDG